MTSETRELESTRELFRGQPTDLVEKKGSAKASDSMEINKGYCVAYTAILCFACWQNSYVNGGTTQTPAVFQAKFGWDNDEAILYNTIISASGYVGLSIGSLVGGSVVPMGRRRTILITQFLCIVASCITMITHEAALSLGRVLLGIAAGIFNVAFGKMITETIPQQWVASFTMSLNPAVAIGYIPCFGLGVLLPDPKDVQANVETEMWRVIWLMPALIGIVSIVLVLVIMPYEPVAFCLMEDR